MIDHNRWRDQQLNGFKSFSNSYPILEQELVMLNFVKTYPNIAWRWEAPDTKFKKICQDHITINNDKYEGVILFGPMLLQKNTQALVNTIRSLTSQSSYAYVAINRYEITSNNLDISLPDSIDNSLDTVIHYCNPKFKRLHTFDHVDGNHMVAAHPMDCYGLCK
jgi:hypothetical protein